VKPDATLLKIHLVTNVYGGIFQRVKLFFRFEEGHPQHDTLAINLKGGLDTTDFCDIQRYSKLSISEYKN
jgi:hypothetical protein